MEIWQAIALGLVQGITEFLPVSSSGHLIVLERWLGVEGGLFLGVMLHVGTLIPLVIVYFRQLVGLFRKPFRKLMYLAAASVPAALVGFLLGDWIDRVFFGGNYVIFGFLATAVLLAAAERRSKRPAFRSIGWKESIVYGLAQAAAVLPGLSRSGTTAAAGCFLGVNREDNAEFCFLMSAPVIFGAALSEGIKAAVGGIAVEIVPILFGVAAAAVSGYLAIRLFLAAMKKANYKWFSLYLIALSIVLVCTGWGA